MSTSSIAENSEPAASVVQVEEVDDDDEDDDYFDGDDALLETIHRLLGSKIRVTMKDGRTVDGTFVCLDRLNNILLEDAIEHRKIGYKQTIVSSDDGSSEEQLYTWDAEREISQAMIRGDKIVKVEIYESEWVERIGEVTPEEIINQQQCQTPYVKTEEGGESAGAPIETRKDDSDKNDNIH
jgi:small nuclear ribonucleoprotein (snRNP)-like protein